MQTLRDDRIKLDSEEKHLLILSVPNEIINGFKVNEFHLTIGASLTEVKALFDGLEDMFEHEDVVLDRQQASIARNALAVVIDELGPDEFETRTGSSFESGCGSLRELEAFLKIKQK